MCAVGQKQTVNSHSTAADGMVKVQGEKFQFISRFQFHLQNNQKLRFNCHKVRAVCKLFSDTQAKQQKMYGYDRATNDRHQFKTETEKRSNQNNLRTDVLFASNKLWSSIRWTATTRQQTTVHPTLNTHAYTFDATSGNVVGSIVPWSISNFTQSAQWLTLWGKLKIGKLK